MGKVINGIIALLSVAAVATTLNATSAVPLQGATPLDYAIVLCAWVIVFGIGALTFEVGKAIGPQQDERS
jgi:heme/copper-type cytochrome/quinol oxidase subunit 2